MMWTEEAIRQHLDAQSLPRPRLKAEPDPVDDISCAVRFVDGCPTLRSVMEVVSRVYKIGILDILSPRRAAHICEARQAFYWLCRNQTARSYPEIGLFCNKRDHSTIIMGIRKIERTFDKHAERLAKCCELLKRRDAA